MKLTKKDKSCTLTNWLEDDIQAYIVQWLRRNDVLFRAGLEGMYTSKRTASKAKMLGMESGWPDIHIIEPDFYVELKTMKGRLSDNQKEMHSKLRSLSKIVYVVKAKTPEDGLKQFLECYNKENLK
jgi:hypothetical protein